ncbi:MAG: ubiquinol-cytochrome C chaperone, partial [Candidatus Devosia euplotis]|nr:ubiquinol-cytochrome C chaperone [Candidatus Devosia euplotis]
MIFNLFRKNTLTEPVYAIYNAIVAQSRQPHFYVDWQVPDTVTGRFDMISLHMALLFRRLRAESGAGKEFSQAVFDLFFKDMDRSLREMGVGDLGVPKRIQKMGNVFFGLLAALSEVMDRDDLAALESVLSRNVFDDGQGPHVQAMAAYLMRQDRVVARQA